MKWLANRSLLVVGGTLGLVLLLLIYFAGNLWVIRQGYAQQIESITPRTARLLGILESAGELGAADIDAAEILDEVAYPAFKDAATTGAAMQKEVRELMIEAGMSIAGSQVLPRQAGQGFDRLTLEITAEGNTEALEQVLASLEVMRPLVFVRSLTVKPKRSARRRSRGADDMAVGDTRNVNARFQLVSLRLKG